MDQDPTCTEVGLGRGHVVLEGDTAPRPRQRGTAPPQFSARVCCSQMAGCFKIPLGTEVGLGAGSDVQFR